MILDFRRDPREAGAYRVLDAETGEDLGASRRIYFADDEAGHFDHYLVNLHGGFLLDSDHMPISGRVHRPIRIVPKAAQSGSPSSQVEAPMDLPRATIEAPGESVELVFHRAVESYSLTRTVGAGPPTVEVFQGDVRAFGRRCAEELARLLVRPPPGPGEAPP